MPLKKWFINRDGLYACNFVFSFKANNSVHHQKRVAMRQDFHDLVSVEPAIAGGHRPRYGNRASSRLLACERANQLRIRGVAGFYRHHMTTNAPPDEREIADDIKDFVPHEFVRETQRFLA